MNRLPTELINRILEYDGRIKYRNGKYMNRISQDDDRYKIVKSLPRIVPFYSNSSMNYWTIWIKTKNKEICIYKSVSYHLHEDPCIYDIVYNEFMSYISFTKQGICYSFTTFLLVESLP